MFMFVSWLVFAPYYVSLAPSAVAAAPLLLPAALLVLALRIGTQRA